MAKMDICYGIAAIIAFSVLALQETLHPQKNVEVSWEVAFDLLCLAVVWKINSTFQQAEGRLKLWMKKWMSSEKWDDAKMEFRLLCIFGLTYIAWIVS
jgi:hypothetical protein